MNDRKLIAALRPRYDLDRPEDREQALVSFEALRDTLGY